MWQIIFVVSVLVWFRITPGPKPSLDTDYKQANAARQTQPAQAINPADHLSSAAILTIPRLSLEAPIIFSRSTDEAVVQKDLEGGVVHFSGTAAPGDEGNVVIFGHSSNYFWRPGKYKTIFARLGDLQSGDHIIITQETQVYTYAVFTTRVVSPRAIEVLDPTETPTLTLITCTPRGTSLRRLVVQAKEIRPERGVEDSEATLLRE